MSFGVKGPISFEKLVSVRSLEKRLSPKHFQVSRKITDIGHQRTMNSPKIVNRKSFNLKLNTNGLNTPGSVWKQAKDIAKEVLESKGTYKISDLRKAGTPNISPFPKSPTSIPKRSRVFFFNKTLKSLAKMKQNPQLENLSALDKSSARGLLSRTNSKLNISATKHTRSNRSRSVNRDKNTKKPLKSNHSISSIQKLSILSGVDNLRTKINMSIDQLPQVSHSASKIRSPKTIGGIKANLFDRCFEKVLSDKELDGDTSDLLVSRENPKISLKLADSSKILDSGSRLALINSTKHIDEMSHKYNKQLNRQYESNMNILKGLVDGHHAEMTSEEHQQKNRSQSRSALKRIINKGGRPFHDVMEVAWVFM